MLGNLGENLQRAMKRISGATIVDKKVLDGTIRDIQRALISSDVSIELVKQLSDRIRERTLKEKIPTNFGKREFILKIVYEELTNLLGTGKKPPLEKKKILLVGLYGSGKTTTAAKIAKYYQKHGLKPGLISTDTWRPAAYEQLRQLGSQIGLDVKGNPKEKDPVKILKAGLKDLSASDIIIVDSAGRDTVDGELLAEIEKINTTLKPDEKWLVLSGDIGQKAGEIAEIFNEKVGLTGVILTKLEGTAKGGGALSAVAYAQVPVVFIGTGEKIDALEEFDAERFLNNVLGMGDLKALMEKAQEISVDFNPEDLLSGKYTLSTFYKQLKAQKKMGSLTEVAKMMGLGNKLPADVLNSSEERMTKYGFVMDSMTPEELEDPSLLNKSRIDRIAAGSGTSPGEIRQLINDFNKSKKVISMFKKGKVPRALKKMMGKLPKDMESNMKSNTESNMES